MTTSVDRRTGLEELDKGECLRLLHEAAVGRLAVVVDGQPLIFPVNFALDDDSIVLRTDEGTKLHGARSGPVAFECDHVDTTYHTGWSVLMTGRAVEVVEPAEVTRLSALPLGPWLPGPTPVWLRIRPRSTTGRRISQHGMLRNEGEH